MKKCILLLFFFILLTCDAFAGTTTLTTWYPPPTAAYNQVKLSTNYTKSPGTYCNGSNNGTLFVDSEGNLYVCTNGRNAIYPQQCYNVFCSYDTSTGANSCSPTAPPQGFASVAVDASGNLYDAFQTSAHTWVRSYAYCSS